MALQAEDPSPTAALQTATVAWLVMGLAVIGQPLAAAKMLLHHDAVHGNVPTWDHTSTHDAHDCMLVHGGVAAALVFGGINDTLTAFGIGYASWWCKIVFMRFVTRDMSKAHDWFVDCRARGRRGHCVAALRLPHFAMQCIGLTSIHISCLDKHKVNIDTTLHMSLVLRNEYTWNQQTTSGTYVCPYILTYTIRNLLLS